MDQFDAYFRKADLDGDGRISGAEAVGFFQGSNLPKPVLAQIWTYADQARSGFLGRPEFYNALKLVTVAQSKRELTPDIVKAALYGPAAAKIPPPQINLAAIPAPQLTQRPVAPTPSQNLGYRAPLAAPNVSMSPPNYSQPNQSMRPPQSMPAPRGSMVGSSVPNSNISSDWLSGKTAGAPAIDSKALAAPGNGFASDSNLGSTLFSVNPSQPKQEANMSTFLGSNAPTSALVPVSTDPTGPQSTISKTGVLDTLQSAYLTRPSGSLPQSSQTVVNPPNQNVITKSTSSFSSSSISSVGAGNSAPSQSQLSWPKMKPSDVQKYTKVFVEVDSDRDGKITGEQARKLFLSWRLPIEVLKQVWDLSDQDNDSMLSLREFCIALYLMERFREGQPLPSALPSNIQFDETLLSVTGQTQAASYGSPTWGTNPGLMQQGMPGPRPVTPSSGLRPPLPNSTRQIERSMQPNMQKSSGSMFVDPFANQLGHEEQNIRVTKSQEETDAEKKVKEPEKVYLDSKEKLEFYRTRMQELVLYKSRCDNRLNEITERASADKREAESLAKKYEEKYKQVGEIASKLTIEEARFRDIQERKMELQQAIGKMEQGGSADGILQVRADRIQSDLDDLMKALTERCKKHGLQINSAALFELPKGWHPGTQEGAAAAADWDEDWDKFEDEGFAFGKEVNRDVQNGNASSKPQPTFNDSAVGSDLFSNTGHESSEDDNNEDFSDELFNKSTDGDGETHTHRRSFDDTDTDSVWGFNPIKTKEESESDVEKNNNTSFTFADSVPATPVSMYGGQSSGNNNSFFDTSSRFDSFSIPADDEAGSIFSPGRQSSRGMSRFDSINSTSTSSNSNIRGFDDVDDPFASTGPFKVS